MYLLRLQTRQSRCIYTTCAFTLRQRCFHELSQENINYYKLFRKSFVASNFSFRVSPPVTYVDYSIHEWFSSLLNLDISYLRPRDLGISSSFHFSPSSIQLLRLGLLHTSLHSHCRHQHSGSKVTKRMPNRAEMSEIMSPLKDCP